jgi:hypothetical protein
MVSMPDKGEVIAALTGTSLTSRPGDELVVEWNRPLPD